MWKRAAVWLIFPALVAAADHDPPAADVSQPAFLVGGIQVHELDHDRWTETLREMGMNTVAVTV